MARTNRPPLSAAREHATKALIAAHADEHQTLIEEYLNRAGWEYKSETRHRWVTVTKGEEG